MLSEDDRALDRVLAPLRAYGTPIAAARARVAEASRAARLARESAGDAVVEVAAHTACAETVVAAATLLPEKPAGECSSNCRSSRRGGSRTSSNNSCSTASRGHRKCRWRCGRLRCRRCRSCCSCRSSNRRRRTCCSRSNRAPRTHFPRSTARPGRRKSGISSSSSRALHRCRNSSSSRSTDPDSTSARHRRTYRTRRERSRRKCRSACRRTSLPLQRICLRRSNLRPHTCYCRSKPDRARRTSGTIRTCTRWPHPSRSHPARRIAS